MGSFGSNVARLENNFMNNVTQQSQINCISSAVSDTSGNVVILNGAVIGGDFTGVEAVTATDSTCLITSTMDSAVSNIISASIEQANKTSTDWFNGFSFSFGGNSFNLDTTITNNINQINQITCGANTTSSANNNYIYATGQTRVGGNFIGVTNKSSADASCVMSNTIKNSVYNTVQATTDQNNTFEGMFVAMVSAFAAIIGGIVIIVIIMFSSGYLAVSRGSGATGTTSTPMINLNLGPSGPAISPAPARPVTASSAPARPSGPAVTSR